jgi:manganese-dependent inorganic pyrophosphatase
VLKPEQHCQGLVSLFKVSQFLFPSSSEKFDSRRVLSSLSKLAHTLGGKVVLGFDEEREDDLTMMIGAMGLDSFASRVELGQPAKLIVVVGDRWDIQNLAIRERVRVLVITGGLSLEPKTLEAAQRNQVSVISSPHDTATTAALCRASIAVRHVLDEDCLTLEEHLSLTEARRRTIASGFLAFPVTDPQGKVVGILSKTDFLKKVDRKLILVDHNELSQAVKGAEQVEIIEIIDHHRIGSLTTQQPILFRNEPVGSTSTIVAEAFFRHGVELTAPIAGLLLAGLVSDTLNLTSPTTTAQDVQILGKLEKLSGVNAREFTEKLFASGSLLTLKPAPQAITTDCKEYVENGTRFSVAQIEEIGFTQFWNRKDELLRELENYRSQKGYSFSALLVTDVVLQCSLLLIVGGEELLERISYPRVEPGIFELRDVVSRKKQLVPYLAHCLE